jgi:hypothetical protein
MDLRWTIRGAQPRPGISAEARRLCSHDVELPPSTAVRPGAHSPRRRLWASLSIESRMAHTEDSSTAPSDPRFACRPSHRLQKLTYRRSVIGEPVPTPKAGHVAGEEAVHSPEPAEPSQAVAPPPSDPESAPAEECANCCPVLPRKLIPHPKLQ